jgi:hypothetical protein
MVLAEATYELWKFQEDAWTRRQNARPLCFRDLDQRFDRQTLRVVQVVAAANQALKLRPGLGTAHWRLYELYMGLNYRDAAVYHLGEFLKYFRDNKPGRGNEEKADAFQKRQTAYKDNLKALETDFKRLESDVKKRLNNYKLQAVTTQNVGNKVFLALSQEYQGDFGVDPRGRGLAKEALKTLLTAPSKEIDLQSALLQFKLLLMLGELQEVRQRLPDLKSGLRRTEQSLKAKADLPNPDPRLVAQKHQLDFHIPWFEALLAAADGDYVGAEEALKVLDSKFQARQQAVQVSSGRLLLGLILRDQLNDRRMVPALGQPLLWGLLHMELNQSFVTVTELSKFAAEFETLRGLVALDHGQNVAALDHFEQALKLTRNLAPYPERLLASRYAELLRKTAAKAER